MGICSFLVFLVLSYEIYTKYTILIYFCSYCCCCCFFNKKNEVTHENTQQNQYELNNFNNVIIPQYNIPNAIETFNKNIQTE